jgi:hypothetical protein
VSSLYAMSTCQACLPSGRQPGLPCTRGVQPCSSAGGNVGARTSKHTAKGLSHCIPAPCSAPCSFLNSIPIVGALVTGMLPGLALKVRWLSCPGRMW